MSFLYFLPLWCCYTFAIRLSFKFITLLHFCVTISQCGNCRNFLSQFFDKNFVKVYFKILKYYFCISLFHDFPHCDFLMILYKKLNDSQRADYDQIVIILAPIETAPLKLIHAKLHTFQIERVMSNFSPHKSFLPKKTSKRSCLFLFFRFDSGHIT